MVKVTLPAKTIVFHRKNNMRGKWRNWKKVVFSTCYPIDRKLYSKKKTFNEEDEYFQ